MKPITNEISTVKLTTQNTRPTDRSAYFTPAQLAVRWSWHPESVRRAIRQGRIAAIVIFNRLLVPVTEVERIEKEGRIFRAEAWNTVQQKTEAV